MRYRKLGNTDIKVSVICLGTMTWGEQNTQNEAFEQLDYSVDQGVNFFDTAELYPVMPKKETYGRTEEIIGNWFQKTGNRDKVVLASKIASKSEGLDWIREGKDRLGFDKKNINSAIDESLKRLKTDYIDLYQLHWPERKVPLFGKLDFNYDPSDNNWNEFEEVLSNFSDLIKLGKIRNLGISNETPWGVMKFLNLDKKKKLFSTLQEEYSLLNRNIEKSIKEIVLREKINLYCYSPLSGGLLTNKYSLNRKERNNNKSWRLIKYSKKTSKLKSLERIKILEKIKKINYSYKFSIMDLSFAFLKNQKFVSGVIIGPKNKIQLDQTIDSWNKKVPKNLITKVLNNVY